MKKFYCITLLGILLLMSACSITVANNTTSHSEVENYTNEKKLIESCEYYKIYDGILTKTYEIYNAEGNLVYSETTDRPLSLTMINDSTIDISKGMGTGLAQHTYYNVKTDSFSDDFLYVICTNSDMIAYIGQSRDGLDNRTLIVQNIYNTNYYYKEFVGVFAKADTYDLSNVKGEFSDDVSKLTVHYFQNNSRERITSTFKL